MNANKKSSGWILCPSKTFPGKFYYFNVLNGETAWGLGDAEKKIIKGDGDILKVTQSHHNPEPSSPPISDPMVTNSVSLTQPKFSVVQYPAPAFGQSVFPKPLPIKQNEPNVIWTPIQIQVPIVIPPESRIQTNEMCQVIGTERILSALSVKSSPDIGKELCVHASSLPLSQRFVNYDKPVISFDKNNKIEDRRQFDKYYTSTPIKSFDQKVIPSFKTIAANADQKFQPKINISFSDLKPKITGQKQLIREPVFNIELPSKTPETVLPLQTLIKDIELTNNSNKAGIAIASPAQEKKVDDLRNLLRAKKRKCLDFNVKSNYEEIKNKKVKTVQDSNPKSTKKVTFNLEYDSIPRNEYEDDYDAFKEKYAATVQSLRELAGPELRSEWHLLVDAEVLLEEFGFLDNFVRIDPNCRLVVPPPVVCEVAAISKGHCPDRSRVLQARNIIRKLTNNQIIVQSADVHGLESPSNDGILKSCVEAMDQNIHVILITNDQELITPAKCYPIHCYKIQDIKNGLAPIPKATGYKQMRITIRNDTEPSFTQNGPAVQSICGTEDLNEKEKIIIRKLKETAVNSNDRENISNDITKIVNSRISNATQVSTENSIFSTTLNKSSLISNDCSRISKRNSVISDEEPTFICTKLNTSGISMNMEEKLKITNTNSTNVMTNARISNGNSTMYNLKALATEWRSAVSDITETTIDIDMKNLNLKEKSYKTTTLNSENKKSNETLSFYFQKPSPKFDFQKFKLKNATATRQTGREQSTLDEKQKGSKFEMNRLKPIFETNEEEPLNTVFEKEKNAHSKFEVDSFKKPQSVQQIGIKNYTNIDLSTFYVKNKIMENRLKDKMDEWMCMYKQIMEECLSSVLEKLPPRVLKSMASPWSLHEALQYTQKVYKKYCVITNITEEITKCLYEVDSQIGKIKKNIIPNEFMKAIGYGIHLIKYLKNILQNSEELSEAEERLTNIMKLIENPESDVEEPLVKPPGVTKTDVKEIRQNFVKNRSEIIKYLKNHYPDWRSYEDSEPKMTVVRTCGRDLNLLRLEKRNNANNDDKGQHVMTIVEGTTVNVGDIATKSVGNITTKVVGNSLTEDVGNNATEKKSNITTNVIGNVMNKVGNATTNGTELKTTRTRSDFENADKLTENKNTIKSTKTEKNCGNPKYLDKCDNTKSKTKIKSVFDFMNTKDTRSFEIGNQESIDKEYKVTNKLKIDSSILGVKITIPNNYKGQSKNTINNEDKSIHEIQKYTKDINETNIVPKVALNIKQIEVQNKVKFNEKNINITEKNGPKIVRNINIIDKYEKIFETRNFNDDIEELDYSITGSMDQNTLKDYESKDTTDNYDQTDNAAQENDLNDHTCKSNDNFTKEYDQNDHRDKPNDINDNVPKEYNLNKYKKNKDELKNHSKVANLKADTQTNGVNQNCDNDSKDFKNDSSNDRKNDKDDMTNDSGLGNESPHVYSVVSSFSAELSSSLDIIQRFTEAVLKCADNAQLLKRTLNMLLTLTIEDGSTEEINSSMSLNMST